MICSFLCTFLLMLSFAFAPQRDPSITVNGGTVDVNFDSEVSPQQQDELLNWIHMAANSVVAYYGRFPLPHTKLQLRTFDGHGVRGGRTFGARDGGLIRISVGIESTPAQLKKDWMMTHEMVHLTFPSVAEEHHWIEEGIATYVEPFARFQAGNMSKEELWGEMARDMHKGLPAEGDEGLDRTHTWGRTYWGGALFCLMADIEIRQHTHNQKGLEDALRGVMNAGGVINQDWELDHVLQVGDKAVGGSVLEDLYAKMKDKPISVDLEKLWQQLGVSQKEGMASFSDQAPLAPIRESISNGKPGQALKVKFSTDELMRVGVTEQ